MQYRCKQAASSNHIEQTQPPAMFALWDAGGNEIRDEYPQIDHHDILRNPKNAIFNLDMVHGRLKEIGGSDIVALHQLAQNQLLTFLVSQNLPPLWKHII